MDGVELIRKERQRQLDYVGEKPYTEFELKDRVLVKAAVAYMFVQNHFHCQSDNNTTPPIIFPFNKKFWNPNKTDDIKNLVKAGVYIAAEIDRLIEIQNNIETH